MCLEPTEKLPTATTINPSLENWTATNNSSQILHHCMQQHHVFVKNMGLFHYFHRKLSSHGQVIAYIWCLGENWNSLESNYFPITGWHYQVTVVCTCESNIPTMTLYLFPTTFPLLICLPFVQPFVPCMPECEGNKTVWSNGLRLISSPRKLVGITFFFFVRQILYFSLLIWVSWWQRAEQTSFCASTFSSTSNDTLGCYFHTGYAFPPVGCVGSAPE